MTNEQLKQALYMSKIVFKVRLRQLMDRDHLLQKELASVIDVSPILISKYVSGSVFPRYKKLYMIATFFGVPLEVLVGQDKLTALYLNELTTRSLSYLWFYRIYCSRKSNWYCTFCT